MLTVINNNESPVCAKCDGACCKSMPGAYHPEQFGPDLAGVKELLESGKASIDWWEGDDVSGTTIENKGYYLRPRIKPEKQKEPGTLARLFGAVKGESGIFDASYGGECVNFTSGKGCSLDFNSRPLVCQSLVPQDSTICDDRVWTKEAIVLAWNPYALLLEKIGS